MCGKKKQNNNLTLLIALSLRPDALVEAWPIMIKETRKNIRIPAKKQNKNQNYFRLGGWRRGNTLERYRWQSPSWAPRKQPVHCCRLLASSTECPGWPEQRNRGVPIVEPTTSVDSSTGRQWPEPTDPAHSNHIQKPNKIIIENNREKYGSS